MQSPSGCSLSNRFQRINQFALVSYIPDPLGAFLDQLRLLLVPDCSPHAHVTILPPRPLCGEAEQAIREIRQVARNFEPFTVRLGNVAKFPTTDVVHLEIESGCEELHAMYQAMNAGASSFCEPFAYSPHITLAQNLPPDQVQDVLTSAISAWRACPHDRSVRVEALSFVQNTAQCRWLDLEELTLRARPLLGDAFTRTDRAEPLHRV